ncbi:coronafacic acid synthetase [Hazenella sp. IB182357]|uniref:Coronafacic acid synthetase n=1 Tax=Polycladospora coralii TaxID=2771432 RepID=A0A926RUQ7_9BACL|nr:coronafacic acid synthetase [Polycladospora coralii]MBD1372674.1 coronafacic acid synthetase [Polycladospora coralii]MBS7531068.1 coronafacic acid synthetase [Polycladospora coralii]
MSTFSREDLSNLYFKNEQIKICSFGMSHTDKLTHAQRKVASFYADPAAWLVVDAVKDALQRFNRDLTPIKEKIGVITISDICTLNTINMIRNQVSKGRVSPIRFAGANPGSMAGLPCIIHGYRGPTLVFTSPLAETIDAVVATVLSWLRKQQASYVFINTYQQQSTECYTVRSILVSELNEVQSPSYRDGSALLARV